MIVTPVPWGEAEEGERPGQPQHGEGVAAAGQQWGALQHGALGGMSIEYTSVTVYCILLLLWCYCGV